MISTLTKRELAASLISVGRYVGNTPLFPIEHMFKKPGVKIYAKLEWHQLGGSIKARAAYNIISEAIKAGHFDGDKELLDASSGNTAIAYATICRTLGIPVTICIPDNASQSRKNALRALGVTLIETPRFELTDGSQEHAAELAEDFPEMYYYADQYSNPANWKAHYYGTAREIYLQSDQQITHFTCGLGTSGTFTGTVKGLKAIDDNIQAIALQPAEPMHAMEGWKHMGTCRMPGIFDPHTADAEMVIETWEAYATMRKASEEEGLLLSPSSAANLAGAIRLGNAIEEGVIVTVFPDNIDRYQELIPQVF